MIPDVSVSTSGDNVETVQSSGDFAAEVSSVKDALLADADAEIAEGSPIYD
jgi:hypothetical protein